MICCQITNCTFWLQLALLLALPACTHYLCCSRLLYPLCHNSNQIRMATRTLLVLHGPLLPYQLLEDLCKSHGVAPDSADITTEPAALAAGGAAKYSKAVVFCSQADVAALGAISKLLAPGASVTVALQSEQVNTPACPEAPPQAATDV